MKGESSYLTQSIMSELETLSADIAKDVASRAKAKRTVSDLLKALGEENADAAARLLQSRAKQLAATYPRVTATLDKLRIDLNRRQEDVLRETCTKLEDYCRTEYIAVRGKPPKYTLDHILEVEFDHEKTRTKVGIQSLPTLEWPSVRDALQAERARLWQRPFVAARYCDRVLQAYQQLQRVSPGPTGWALLEGIYQVLKEQAEAEDPDWRKGGRLVAYYKDEFSADLSMLWESQASGKLDPPHIEFSAIRDPRRAYRLIQPDRTAGFYGFLRPREV